MESSFGYVNLSASAQIKNGKGWIGGFFVSAASATPTIKIWDNIAGSGTVLIDTFTPVAGTSYYFPIIAAKTGLYITISGTVDVTVFYK